ncbi:MAG: amidotransferase [Thermodesulfatator sp.]|nr:MAG: amidotransferase [Thermodesulfatator sp.]
MKLHYLQHVPFETPRAILEWAKEREFSFSATRFFAGEDLPEDLPDFLVIMGGPMSAHDEDRYPWLAEEKTYLKKAVEAGIPVLGICLGAQLLAEVLGAKVYKGPYREIGWFPVELTAEGREHPLFRGLPSRFVAFHWHGETFDLPQGALHLARSAGCEHQAFVWGERVLALQFHLEMTPEGAEDLLKHCPEDLHPPGPYVQEEQGVRGKPEFYQEARGILFRLLDRLSGLQS